MKPITVWRYMDFTKFVGLLSTRALFFCRADKFADPFEGSVPRAYLRRKTYEKRSCSSEDAEAAEWFAKYGSEFRKYTFINCWHMSEHESAALWKLYITSGEGVAIRSTLEHTRAAISGTRRGRDIHSASVMYIDYGKDTPPVMNRLSAFICKRKSFEHEKELRHIWLANIETRDGERRPPPAENGVRIKADLDLMIRSIYVSPTSSEWFRRLTKSVCLSFGLNKTVRQSKLIEEIPMFP